MNLWVGEFWADVSGGMTLLVVFCYHYHDSFSEYVYIIYIYIYLLISPTCYSANSSPVSLRIGRHVLPAFFLYVFFS